MKGWEILAHSVRLVFNNFEQALRISVVPYAVSSLAFILFSLPATRAMESDNTATLVANAPGAMLGHSVYTIISVAVALWIAVGWHRYVLLEEYPKGWISRFHGTALRGYFWRSLLIGLIIAPVFLIVVMIVGTFLAASSAGALLTLFIGMAVSTYLFYRICVVLPAAALGHSMQIGEAWNRTREASNTIVALVVLVLAASILIQMPATLGSSGSVFGIVYTLIINWLMTMIGASVLTTFYGHFIEHRPID